MCAWFKCDGTSSPIPYPCLLQLCQKGACSIQQSERLCIGKLWRKLRFKFPGLGMMVRCLPLCKTLQEQCCSLTFVTMFTGPSSGSCHKNGNNLVRDNTGTYRDSSKGDAIESFGNKFLSMYIRWLISVPFLNHCESDHIWFDMLTLRIGNS